ncbi:hypothetical protein TYRP_016206 [Tyrophagus putrescentiae]|nr:hypothetical protein TYRP_016206 [Tyrophagus putrescentiae]
MNQSIQNRRAAAAFFFLQRTAVDLFPHPLHPPHLHPPHPRAYYPPSPDSLVALPLVHPLVQPEEKTYVVGVEGARSVLPCNVTAKLNDTIDLILWFRGAEEKALLLD